MAVGRLIGLLGVDILALYTLFVMMPYLTDVWGLGFTNAAAILNIFWGLCFILPLLWKFLNDTVLRNYWVLFFSSITYCTGLGLLWMSSPPVTGSCSEYKPECIGHKQQVLFYIALAFIALGFSGHITSWNAFMSEQMMEAIEGMFGGENGDQAFNSFWRMFWRMWFATFATVIITIAAVFAIPYIKPWSVRFGIPAIFSLVATFLFLSGSCSYRYIIKPGGSPFTTLVRVFVASMSKLLYRSPRNSGELYEIQDAQYLLPHTRSLRCLDKAAVVMPTKPLEEQKQNRWRLCRLTEVEETKVVIRAIPVWVTFILGGVVSSIGTTYFVEQVNHLNPKLGRLKLPIVLMLLVHDKVKEIVGPWLYEKLQCFGKYAPSVGIAVSMILSILCCITAAKVENRRLGVVRAHGLVDKPDERVPMTMFWMLPQFVLLGMFDGLFECSTVLFFVEQFPVPTRPYLPFYIIAVSGLGFLGSVLSVFVVGKVSEKGGKRNWFQHDLNASRLDKYYWTLAWLMAINLVVFIIVAVLYRYMEPAAGLEEVDDPEEDDEGCELPIGCCCCCG